MRRRIHVSKYSTA
jgi:hypothetical protein